ncbi:MULTISPECIES: Ca2+-dependent phosphoinositide-specific phospholipase C [Acidobacterium]|uniref:Uncharacterized protein n=1 Tax=Acidobacterium capsulatum (strain ATCC 51196 / DSM 11244 / BCRC 80197 / JCM 7670 / NBRC 15755 / NCIMB 13165 / 161) TaxID=240015 RepID=C1F161_ACIC5|nr:conserved hypothetical protein [Acidobacterium capsulatum ATCC 51196]
MVFLLDQKSVGPAYLAGHPSLRGRVLFTNATPGQPDAAFIEQNSASASQINALSKRDIGARPRPLQDTC